MRKLLQWNGVVLWLSLASVAQANLKIYYLRHAEAGHNVVAKFVASGIPTNEWPVWVGHTDMFTPEGEAQVRGVTTNLLAYKFDFIAVSPTWRTRQTIFPYLQATGRTAEI
ncbi:MAG: histidine phosphatase family protein [Verrucomicrobiota bacterium]